MGGVTSPEEEKSKTIGSVDEALCSALDEVSKAKMIGREEAPRPSCAPADAIPNTRVREDDPTTSAEVVPLEVIPKTIGRLELPIPV